jgi:hypothetical protein
MHQFTTQPIDYKLDKSWLSTFQKTLIITHTKRTVKPGGAFEDTAFKQGFEIVKL